MWCKLSGVSAAAPISDIMIDSGLAAGGDNLCRLRAGCLGDSGAMVVGVTTVAAACGSHSPPLPPVSCSLLTSASPRTFSVSATRNSGPICSWYTFISPLYMKSTTARSSGHWTSLSMTIGCLHLFSANMLWKYGLQAERTILCALSVCPSQAMVTSTNVPFCKSWSNTFVRLLW